MAIAKYKEGDKVKIIIPERIGSFEATVLTVTTVQTFNPRLPTFRYKLALSDNSTITLGEGYIVGKTE
jgi:hypothetical protein